MFCSNCGTQSKDGAKFCPGCGAVLGTNAQANVAVQPADWGNVAPTVEEEVIDLTGQVDANKPREKRHKGIILTGFILGLVWIAFPFLIWLICAALGFVSEDEVFYACALFSLPIGVIALPIVLLLKKKAKLTQKLKGTENFVMGFFGIMMPAFGLVAGLGHAFFQVGIGTMVTMALLVMLAIIFVILGFVLAIQYGEEGVYSMLTSAAIGFLVGPITGYFLGLALAMIEMLMVFMLIGAIAFFLLGGRVIFVQIRN